MKRLPQAIWRKLAGVVLATILLLMIPLIAMNFTDEVNWDAIDFILMGGMLLVAGFTYLYVSTFSGVRLFKLAVAIALLSGFLLAWTNLAVGLIGSEGHPANLLYISVLFVGIVGAFLSRLKPLGLMKTMYCLAATQFLIPLVVWAAWRTDETRLSGFESTLVLNTVFSALFLSAALLFRQVSVNDSVKNR